MAIKKFAEFIKETDVVGDDAVMATKPTALSEEWCKKVQECMENAMSEAKAWHEDEDPGHTAESWVAEGKKFVNECMESLVRECSNMTNLGGDTYNSSDGNMRQGSIQDIGANSI